jgi:transcriptional regulator with XRE-family HTH domain
MVARERTLTAGEQTEVNQIRRALRHEHDQRGTPLRVLAAAIGCSKTQVSNILHGAQPFPKTLVKLRRWYDKHGPARALNPERAVMGAAFPTFPNLRLPPEYGRKLLRAAELEALRYYAWRGDAECPSFASLALRLGVDRGEMLRFIHGASPTPVLEDALRRFVPLDTVRPPVYGMLPIAAVVDAVVEIGVDDSRSAALRIAIVDAVQDFCRSNSVDPPDWISSVASAYSLAVDSGSDTPA